MKKTLYIGLGGTGIRTLLSLKKRFVDTYGDVPSQVGFLAIDTDSGSRYVSVLSRTGEEIILSPDECCICHVFDPLSVYMTFREEFKWLPKAVVGALPHSACGCGAKVFPAIGHFVAYVEHNALNSQIRQKISQLQIARDSPENSELPIEVVVITSLAGGTGAGMLVDILCEVRDVSNNGSVCSVTPYLVMPEVFCRMEPQFFNRRFYSNAYCTLRTLDYIQNIQQQDTPIQYGRFQIDSPLFTFAYIFGNKNSQNDVLPHISVLTEYLAGAIFWRTLYFGNRCANIMDLRWFQVTSGVWDILNKHAWAASLGYSELEYDSKAVRQGYLNRVSQQICKFLTRELDLDYEELANRFVDDKDIKIRENNGRTDVCDAFLSSHPSSKLIIDKNTTETDIQCYIRKSTEDFVCDESIVRVFEQKIASTKEQLERYVERILSAPESGSLVAVIRFVESLLTIVSDMRKEKCREEIELWNMEPRCIDWSEMLLEAYHKKFLLFFEKADQQKEQELRCLLDQVVVCRREKIRRIWAIRFFDEISCILKEKLNFFEGLETRLNFLFQSYSKTVDKEKTEDSIMPRIIIPLHRTALQNACVYELSESERSEVCIFFASNIWDWELKNETMIADAIMSFANGLSVVQSQNKLLKDILSEEITSNENRLLNQLFTHASPYWTPFREVSYNAEIYLNDQVADILSAKHCLDYLREKRIPVNASMPFDDRMVILKEEGYLPIFAVVKMEEYGNFVKYDDIMPSYTDELLEIRMKHDNFSINPCEPPPLIPYCSIGV